LFLEQGVVGVGGVVYNPEGNLKFKCAWGLGEATNNQEEMWAPWQ